ncbi:pentatricopeptide repeat-containing protein At2g33680-like [Magnolia sinica]|uniref:pentatricopeptide repeat-containing protein At2g33680-like n=1 Tax=Magnolia sinica TaxID=86752 RepID=UPI0026581616|nr:pentatricopeptide repeat-containing protein At2g33680-like [Magnolia sinica]
MYIGSVHEHGWSYSALQMRKTLPTIPPHPAPISRPQTVEGHSGTVRGYRYTGLDFHKMTEIPSILSRKFLDMTPSVLGSVLSECSKSLHPFNFGRSIHALILKRKSLHLDLYLQNHLINFYAKCKRMACAQRVFDEIPVRNMVSWTALISGYDQCGRADQALEVFSTMISKDPSSRPNEFTYASAVSACTRLECLAQGMQVHSHALQRGIVAHVLVSNVLISLYMSSGCVTEAELIFKEIPNPDPVSWNSLISGLSQNGFFQTALERFQRMRELDVRITSFVLPAAIVACLEDEMNGKGIHGLAIKMGLDLGCFTGSALIRIYSEFKNMGDAFAVFQMLGFKDVASWNSLIEGYSRSSQGERGLQLFSAFMESGLKADEITMISVIGICTSLVMLDYGRQLHCLSAKTGLNEGICVENSMIDMYAKCGSLEDGIMIFRQMKERSVISWTVMMGGLGHHGRANDVLQLFEEMKREGMKPNKVTYTCVLSACGHSRLVNLGQSVFESMEIEPEVDHYACMVHLLAGGGRLEEAAAFIRSSPVEYGEVLWQSFLVACKNLGEWERGMGVAEKILRAGPPADSPTLVLLSHVFAATGRWEEVGKLRKEMKERQMKKEPGCSWIEVDGEVQIFGMKKQVRGCISTDPV